MCFFSYYHPLFNLHILAHIGTMIYLYIFNILLEYIYVSPHLKKHSLLLACCAIIPNHFNPDIFSKVWCLIITDEIIDIILNKISLCWSLHLFRPLPPAYALYIHRAWYLLDTTPLILLESQPNNLSCVYIVFVDLPVIK